METENPSDQSDNEKQSHFLIVAIGASAGGVKALQAFFEQVPAVSGMAYVVILHLSPSHDSKLAEVLQAVTPVPVSQVTENTALEPDHIYVVPPNQHLLIRDGFLAPSPHTHVEDRRAPVDIFFRNLADAYGARAVCVVLSGTGANGSMGLKRVKERGGVAFVQNPREAEYNDMPRSAIATDLVDEVLPVADIPARIMAYRSHAGSHWIIPEIVKQEEPQQQALRDIFTQLRVQTGHDFTNYKRPTLLRRIERRINLRNLPNLLSYAAFIHANPEETNALLKDLLISVTNFFRDSKPFSAIEQEVMPKLFDRKTPDDVVRIWVAGCATGEEAYSLAMLCAERMLDRMDAPKVQIFATDIDEAAISTAREGLYSLSDAADVSADRLKRYFTREGENFRIRREIREMVLFAHHNFLKDPPFSRLDLISCRNVLIYLNSVAQARVVETFHFALKPRGFLFLGNSEAVDGASDLYSTFSRENHIFQAREVSPLRYPVPESVPSFHFPKNNPLQKPDEVARPARLSYGELHQRLLEQYAPPSVVVNEEYEIVHMTQGAGKYLLFTGGEPTQNILKLVRPELRLELRSALLQAVQYQTAVETRMLPLELNGQPRSLAINIRPVLTEDDTAKGFILVLFREEDDHAGKNGSVMIASDEPVSKQLEEELVRLKAQLNSSAQQYEFHAEELKASNEEFQAMNEELRSAAEELETSKEELQSINEELRTVNQELKIKIEEISLVSNNLQNLINSAEVGTVFLDRSFCIRLFTPAVLEIFNLKTADYGRPISDITNRLQYDHLLEDAEMVLEKLASIEREVSTTEKKHYLMRVLPYRTAEDRINGVVITFFNITERKQAENALQKSEQYLRLLIEGANDYAIYTLNTEGTIVSWSTGAENVIGYTEANIVGQLSEVIFTPEDRAAGIPAAELIAARQVGRAENKRWHLRQDGSQFWGSGSVSPLWDGSHNLIGYVKILRDETAQKELDETLSRSKEEHRLSLEKEVEQRTSELKEINANLWYANENLKQFASIASHDLQEPLRKIQMFTSVLNKNWGSELPTAANEVMHKITVSTDRMSQLIMEILEYSMIAYGDRQFARIDLNDVLQNVLQDLNMLIGETKAVVEVDEPLPVIEAVALQMQQLFYNLLNNALKFQHPKTGAQIRITTNHLDGEAQQKFDSLAPHLSYVDITVSDNGIGFDSQFSEQIFQIFERLHTAEEYEGTGIGLALCKKITENHHGHIYALSKKNEGASFHVLLPVRQ